MAATDAAVFTDLLDFVRGSHASSRDLLASQGRWGGAGKRALPAGLVLAGGVNASDHAQTFPALASHLRNQVELGLRRLALDEQSGVRWARCGASVPAAQAAERQGACPSATEPCRARQTAVHRRPRRGAT